MQCCTSARSRGAAPHLANICAGGCQGEVSVQSTPADVHQRWRSRFWGAGAPASRQSVSLQNGRVRQPRAARHVRQSGPIPRPCCARCSGCIERVVLSGSLRRLCAVMHAMLCQWSAQCCRCRLGNNSVSLHFTECAPVSVFNAHYIFEQRVTLLCASLATRKLQQDHFRNTGGCITRQLSTRSGCCA